MEEEYHEYSKFNIKKIYLGKGQRHRETFYQRGQMKSREARVSGFILLAIKTKLKTSVLSLRTQYNG